MQTAKAIESVQNMAQWMLDNGADERATNESLDIIETELRKNQKRSQPVAWRTRDLNGDGWVVFATEEKGLAWIKSSAPTRSHNSLHPLTQSVRPLMAPDSPS